MKLQLSKNRCSVRGLFCNSCVLGFIVLLKMQKNARNINTIIQAEIVNKKTKKRITLNSLKIIFVLFSCYETGNNIALTWLSVTRCEL